MLPSESPFRTVSTYTAWQLIKGPEKSCATSCSECGRNLTLFLRLPTSLLSWAHTHTPQSFQGVLSVMVPRAKIQAVKIRLVLSFPCGWWKTEFSSAVACFLSWSLGLFVLVGSCLLKNCCCCCFSVILVWEGAKVDGYTFICLLLLLFFLCNLYTQHKVRT